MHNDNYTTNGADRHPVIRSLHDRIGPSERASRNLHAEIERLAAAKAAAGAGSNVTALPLYDDARPARAPRKIVSYAAVAAAAAVIVTLGTVLAVQLMNSGSSDIPVGSNPSTTSPTTTAPDSTEPTAVRPSENPDASRPIPGAPHSEQYGTGVISFDGMFYGFYTTESNQPETEGRRYGLLDAEGHVVIEARYDGDVYPLRRDRFFVYVGGTFKIIDEKETVLLDLRDGGIALPPSHSESGAELATTDVLLVHKIENDGKTILYSIYDINGRRIGNGEWDYLAFSESIAIGDDGGLFAMKDGRSYLLDKKGTITHTYPAAPWTVEEYFGGALKKTEFFAQYGRRLYGLVNAAGKTVLKCEYYQLTVLSADRILACIGSDLDASEGTSYLFDAKGSVISDGEYDYIRYFKHSDGSYSPAGIATGYFPSAITPDLYVYGQYLVDQSGRRIIEDRFDELGFVNEDGDLLSATKDGKTYTIDLQGNRVG